jgi:hypothetical protein
MKDAHSLERQRPTAYSRAGSLILVLCKSLDRIAASSDTSWPQIEINLSSRTLSELSKNVRAGVNPLPEKSLGIRSEIEIGMNSLKCRSIYPGCWRGVNAEFWKKIEGPARFLGWP